MIVIAGQDMMPDIEVLISKLDIPTPENTGKINVYYLENAESEEVAKVLSALTERQPGTRQAAAGRAPTIKGIITAELEGGVKITADKATNSLIIIAGHPPSAGLRGSSGNGDQTGQYSRPGRGVARGRRDQR
jgi:general secretion pathway protein D